MATIADIQNALAQAILGAVYPNGIDQPSIADVDVIIYPGWPNPAELDQYMAQGKVQITIFKLRGMERNVKAFPGNWINTDDDGTTAIATRELRRQQQAFMISIWAPTNELRDLVGNAVDVALTAAVRLTLPDGETEFLMYQSMNEFDDMQKSAIYRRDLIYSIEYATTQTKKFNVITDVQINSTYS